MDLDPNVFDEGYCFEDESEVLNAFSVNFVEDTLEIVSIGLFTQSSETSMDDCREML